MAKLTDDQIRFIIDLDAKGAQGQINTLEESIRSLEKENGNPKRAIIVEKKEIPAIVQELLRQRSKVLKQYFYLLSHHQTESAKSMRYKIRQINKDIESFSKFYEK